MCACTEPGGTDLAAVCVDLSAVEKRGRKQDVESHTMTQTE